MAAKVENILQAHFPSNKKIKLSYEFQILEYKSSDDAMLRERRLRHILLYLLSFKTATTPAAWAGETGEG